MNYLEIVLQGYFNENNREFLEKYFLREFKKAEKEQFFEADEFFNGCLKVIERWQEYLTKEVLNQKKDLYVMLSEAENGTLLYKDLEGKTIEQKRQETIEYCEQELKDVRPDGIGRITFTVHLSSLTNGRINYNMSYDEVLKIKLSILNAFQKAQPKKQALPPQQIEKPKPELKLKDFFIKEVSSDTIAAIQTKFKKLEGKDLAILIYLLHKEYTIIEILTNSRTKGRKGFVKCLKEIDNPTMQKVNKCFEPNTDNLIYPKDDLVFQSLNKRLTETIKK
jgi:hypothetical protein